MREASTVFKTSEIASNLPEASPALMFNSTNEATDEPKGLFLISRKAGA